MKEVFVFQICESDAVAARSQEEARKWYTETTGVLDEELYDYEEVETISLDEEFYEDENRINKISLRKIVEKHWRGEPFIALSSEW